MKHDIRAFIMDVDGTMTDGKIYMGDCGEVFKAFDIQDGYGIHEILPKYNIKTIILTGRKSKIVSNRAEELEIDYVYQGVKDKATAIKRIKNELNLEKEHLAYIGDDIIDIPAMNECGVVGCPANAVKEVKEISSYITRKKGGEGAVREFIEWLIESEREEK